MKLAVNNGTPFRNKKWPTWPIWDESANKYIQEVIRSGRWTVRGSWTGTECMEMQFAKLFAEYNQCSYCVLTTSGSVALLLALEALDIGPGDEVIVPALTWIAPITAVLNAGATPVLVDINPDTSCMEPIEVKKAIGPKTRAIMPVHLHCSIVNMDDIQKIAKEYGLFIIEDCSQAHGAMWGENRVGTMGDLGVFSMNQEKVLTCGEGGAVITNNYELYEKLFRMKTDGCNFDPNCQRLGEEQLIYDNKLMGANYSISEFQSAILISQLAKLERSNQKRESNAKYLDEGLSGIPGLKPLKRHEKILKRSYYEYAIRLDNAHFGNKELSSICKALSAELGFCLHLTDVPLYRNQLFSPWTRKRYQFFTKDSRFHFLKAENFPGCEAAYNSYVVFHHSFLLSEKSDMDDIIKAFGKVHQYSHEINC